MNRLIQAPCILFTFFLLMLPAATETAPLQAQTTVAGSSDLKAYMAPLVGYWMDEGSHSLIESPSTQSLLPEPDLAITFHAEWIGDSLVKAVISEYCEQAQVDYLFFKFDAAYSCLRLIGGQREGCFVEIPRIVALTLWYEQVDNETILYYQATEEGGTYQAWVRLKKAPSFPSYAEWSCGLQLELIQLLIERPYRIFNSEEKAIRLEEAFGPHVKNELIFWADHQNFLPMYEEICVRSPFDVVIIGGVHPTSNMRILAIEWMPQSILLFETHFPDAEDGPFLRKGKLLFQIVPGVTPLLDSF